MTRFTLRHFQRRDQLLEQPSATTARTQLRRLVQIDVVARLSGRRWCLPLIISAVLALVFGNDLRTQSAQGLSQANAWDLLFRIYANPYGTIYCFTPLFLYLVSDLQAESGFNESLLLRIRSRTSWWIGKVITLGLLVCVYLIMVSSAALLIANFMLPWAASWSEYTLHDPIRITLPPTALYSGPATILILQIMLLGMGWFSLGLVVLVGSLMLKDEKWGFGLGMLLNLCSIIALHADIPAPLSTLPINYHLVVGTHAFGDLQSDYPTLTVSFTYWGLWMVAIPIVGWRLSKRHDVLRKA